MKLSVKLNTLYDCKAFTYGLRNMLRGYFSDNLCGGFKVQELSNLDKDIECVDDYTKKLNEFFNDVHLIKCEITAIKRGVNVVVRGVTF